MPAESVVDALRKVQRSLIPDGILLDCHPTPEAVHLEVVGSSGTTPVGRLDYSDDFARNIENAGRAYASLSAEGIFLRQGEARYSIKFRLTTFDEWEQYWAEESAYYVEPQSDLFPTLETLMAEPGAVLVLDIAAVANRFKRLG